ncbi:MAG TPA: hypothetical protein VFC99_06810 [Acidimicrobiia bacterium]|nr:hypothetical protein [Acidimicrobiia bacterium]
MDGGASGSAVVIVVVSGDAGRGGEAVRVIEESGRRAALFVGDPTFEEDRTALLELVDELFTPGDA